MANNFRAVYLYIICFITLSMIIGGIVATVNNITSYLYPDSYAFFETDLWKTNTNKINKHFKC